jgi:hypothetical protein
MPEQSVTRLMLALVKAFSALQDALRLRNDPTARVFSRLLETVAAVLARAFQRWAEAQDRRAVGATRGTR